MSFTKAALQGVFNQIEEKIDWLIKVRGIDIIPYYPNNPSMDGYNWYVFILPIRNLKIKFYHTGASRIMTINGVHTSPTIDEFTEEEFLYVYNQVVEAYQQIVINQVNTFFKT